MAEASRLVREDGYEEMGSSYQCLQVELLDSALQEHGVADADVRRKVCETFLFSMGVFHDQRWLKTSVDSERLYPILCFSNQFLDSDTTVDRLGTIYVPSPMFSFHEYAFGNASLLYEGDPNASVETGRFAGEEGE